MTETKSAAIPLKANKKRGRPSGYTQAMSNMICTGLESGTSLIQLCKRPGFPVESMVYRWLHLHEDFRENYARARTIQAWRIFEETLPIADDESRDTSTDDKGRVSSNMAAIGRDRLKVDTRKWFLSKLLPKTFGEHTGVELTGPGGGPVQVEISDRELARRLAFLLYRANMDKAETIEPDKQNLKALLLPSSAQE